MFSIKKIGLRLKKASVFAWQLCQDRSPRHVRRFLLLLILMNLNQLIVAKNIKKNKVAQQSYDTFVHQKEIEKLIDDHKIPQLTIKSIVNCTNYKLAITNNYIDLLLLEPQETIELPFFDKYQNESSPDYKIFEHISDYLFISICGKDKRSQFEGVYKDQLTYCNFSLIIKLNEKDIDSNVSSVNEISILSSTYYTKGKKHELDFAERSGTYAVSLSKIKDNTSDKVEILVMIVENHNFKREKNFPHTLSCFFRVIE